ncbi:hypothetical protein Btru_046747 [Bulinus truncatus]|nr:hypothetical protein Btru_046747 [Bulinus truncatus]
MTSLQCDASQCTGNTFTFSAGDSRSFNQPILCCLSPHKLTAGTLLKITGQTTKDFKSFSINLTPDDNIEEKCLLHFCPRVYGVLGFAWSVVVMNNQRRCQWQREERGFPNVFFRDFTFEVVIRVTSSGYEISVNGSHCYSFSARDCNDTAKYLFIKGDCNIYNISIVNLLKVEQEITPAQPKVVSWIQKDSTIKCDEYYPAWYDYLGYFLYMCYVVIHSLITGAPLKPDSFRIPSRMRQLGHRSGTVALE